MFPTSCGQTSPFPPTLLHPYLLFTPNLFSVCLVPLSVFWFLTHPMFGYFLMLIKHHTKSNIVFVTLPSCSSMHHLREYMHSTVPLSSVGRSSAKSVRPGLGFTSQWGPFDFSLILCLVVYIYVIPLRGFCYSVYNVLSLISLWERIC